MYSIWCQCKAGVVIRPCGGQSSTEFSIQSCRSISLSWSSPDFSVLIYPDSLQAPSVLFCIPIHFYKVRVILNSYLEFHQAKLWSIPCLGVTQNMKDTWGSLYDIISHTSLMSPFQMESLSGRREHWIRPTIPVIIVFSILPWLPPFFFIEKNMWWFF